MSAETDAASYVAARDVVLRHLDVDAYREFCRGHGIPAASDDVIAMAAMHKARLVVTAFSLEEKQVSREWLAAHGFRPTLFGEPQ